MGRMTGSIYPKLNLITWDSEVEFKILDVDIFNVLDIFDRCELPA